MTYSEIKITFNQEMPINGAVRITYSINSVMATIFELWKSTRFQSFQVTMGTPTAIIGEISAINFIKSFNLDFNASNLFELTRTNNIVYIKSHNPELKFESGLAYKKTKGGSNGQPRTSGQGTCTVRHSGTFSAPSSDTVEMILTGGVKVNGVNYNVGTYRFTGSVSYITDELHNTSIDPNWTIRFINLTTGEESNEFDIGPEVVDEPC